MGAKIVQNNCAKIAASIHRQLERAVEKAAFDVEANAQVAAPIDTGFLRATIGAGKVGPGHWRVVAHAAYARFVELGTYRTKAHPFLVPALDRVRPILIRAIKAIKARG